MTFIGAITIITCAVAASIYLKTKRIGPTIAAVIGGGVVVAAKDTAVMQSIGTAIGSIFTTVFGALPGMLSNGG